MTKALFLDIDGTLVSFKTHRIPQSTIEAIRMARNKGIKVFTSTGRPRQLLGSVPDMEGLFDGYVLANGAHCIIGDTTVRKQLIPRDEAERLLDYCNTHQRPVFVVGMDDIQYANPNETMRHVIFELLKVTYNKFDLPMEQVLGQGIVQMTPFISANEEQHIMPEMPHSTSTRWHPTFCDVMAAGADKATGLAAVAEALGISVAETMAFGDGGNDISMLRAAGTGVAMGNALDCVRQHADYVTTSVDDDGVYNALRHFGII